MEENQNKEEENSCLDSASFSLIGAFIIIFEIISLIMSILCLVIINWDFLKNFIRILNIISLVLIILTILINLHLFIKIKKIKFHITKKYGNRMCCSFLLLLMYIILIIFGVYNAIYISTKLHISDDPEYGGRTRDQDYIDKHPEKFGDVPVKQFIVSGVCPSIIAVFNLICFILCIIFRKKMIIIYNKIISENDKKINDDNLNRKIRRSKSVSKKRTSRNTSSKSLRNKETAEIKNYNNNELEPIEEVNGIKLERIDGITGVRKIGGRRFTILTMNDPTKIEYRSPRRLSSRNLLTNRKTTRETTEEEINKYKSTKINKINFQEDFIKNKDENDKDK